MAPSPPLPALLLVGLVAAVVGALAGVAAAGGYGAGLGAEDAGKKPHKSHGKFKGGPWTDGHVTFYGGRDGSGTKDGGACGYKEAECGFGVDTAAVSPNLFANGAGCGACFEIKGAQPGAPAKSIVITANNQAPPPVSGYKGEHFDLTMPAFLQIAEEKLGVVPVTYRRVACPRKGGIKYTITGSKSYTMVMVTNVGGQGDVVALSVKGDKRVKWTPLKRSWGQTWVTEVDLTGESLTFRVMTGDHRKATSWHVTPKDWTFGKTYQSDKNF